VTCLCFVYLTWCHDYLTTWPDPEVLRDCVGRDKTGWLRQVTQNKKFIHRRHLMATASEIQLERLTRKMPNSYFWACNSNDTFYLRCENCHLGHQTSIFLKINLSCFVLTQVILFWPVFLALQNCLVNAPINVFPQWRECGHTGATDNRAFSLQGVLPGVGFLDITSQGELGLHVQSNARKWWMQGCLDADGKKVRMFAVSMQ